jgi:hypothetical protein
VLIAGVGEGGVGVDREPAEAPSPTLHGELSGAEGFASGGLGGDLPMHGAPTVRASAGILGYGPTASVSGRDGAPPVQFGVRGPLSNRKSDRRTAKSAGKRGVGADASVDVQVPLSWRCVQPDILLAPIGHHLYFGLSVDVDATQRERQLHEHPRRPRAAAKGALPARLGKLSAHTETAPLAGATEPPRITIRLLDRRDARRPRRRPPTKFEGLTSDAEGRSQFIDKLTIQHLPAYRYLRLYISEHATRSVRPALQIEASTLAEGVIRRQPNG